MPRQETKWLTTGQAARICTVTPDTVLKWIKKGRLEATRTAGGHYRIDRRELEPHVPVPAPHHRPDPPPASCSPQPLRCWEYMSDRGQLRKECISCVVYRVRAAWCYQVADLEADIGHARKFCGATCCEDCTYYRRLRGLATNVLVVTSDEGLIAGLAAQEHEKIAVSFARSGYEAAAVIGGFRPAVVAVDHRLVQESDPDLLRNLARDTRVPGLKIFLAVEPDSSLLDSAMPPDFADAVIAMPFDTATLAEMIDRYPVELSAAGDRRS